MWNERAANPVGSAPAETPEQPEPAYESKQDEPSRLDPATDPRTLEAPATDEEDPLASLPADFAAFSLTQTHPKSSDAKVEPFEQQRQRGPRVRRIYEKRVGAYARRYKTRMCIYGDACPYGPGRCFFAHDAAELRPPQARWWLPEYKTKPCRYAASECPFYADGRCQYAHTVRGPASPSRTESRMCTAAGRGAPVRAAAAGEDAGPEVQDAHVPLRRGRLPLRRELLLRAQRRRFSARNSTLCGVFMRVGPRAGGAPAARARRAAGRADRRRQPARAAPRPPRRRQPLGGRVRGAQAAGPARAGLVRGPSPGAAGADGAAAAAAPLAAAAGRLHAARDGDAAARGAATAGVRPAAAVRRGAGAAARVRRAPACTSRLRRPAATVRVGPAATAAAGS